MPSFRVRGTIHDHDIPRADGARARELTSSRQFDMRRQLSSLLLAFCLVVSQQGALLHALRHDLAHAAASSGEVESHPAGVGCSTCLAFAHLAGVVTSAAIAPLLLRLAFHWFAATPFAHRPADAPQARARDPPVGF